MFCVSFITYADPGGDTTPVPYNDYLEGTSVVVTQFNNSYAGWNNTSPTHYGTLTSSENRYPISLASIGSLMSTINTSVGPTTIDVIISNPHISSGAIIYCGMFNAYGWFRGSDNIDLFSWVDSIPGYVPKYTPSSTFGYVNTLSTLQTSSPSNFSCVTNRINTGTNSSNATLNNTVVGVAMTPTLPTSTNYAGSVSVQPVYKSATNGYRLVRVISTANTMNVGITDAMSIRFRYDVNDLVKCNPDGLGNSNDHLHSAVFVPIALCLPQYSNDVISKLDTIVSRLSSISLGIDNVVMNTQTIIDALYSGNESIISVVADICTEVEEINNKLNSVTGNRYSSAVQYIEYYLEHVMSNTDIMVNQINDIISTLNSISDTIQNANDNASAITDTSESQHEAEQEIFEQANNDIGSTVIESFAFDVNTSSGMGRVGIDFNNLWMSMGQWSQVYVFSMTLTLALTIIRYSVARSKKKNEDKNNSGDG